MSNRLIVIRISPSHTELPLLVTEGAGDAGGARGQGELRPLRPD